MDQSPKLKLDTLYKDHPYAKTILLHLEQAGFDALLVGGAVRGLAMQSIQHKPLPTHPIELDIATSATPDEIRKIFPDWHIVEVGKSFGVLILKTPDDQAYEVATFRTESEYDGRRPQQVTLTRSFEEDVHRRDFTINGLAARVDGSLIDLVGGIDDLKLGLIRTIGESRQRFAEDHLRLLRAVRFACQLDFQIEDGVKNAIRQRAEYVRKLSAERVREELWQMFSTSKTRRGVELLDKLQLLEYILPEISRLKGVPQPQKYHPEGDVFVHTLLALDWADRLRFPPLSKFAVLLHDIGKPQALIENAGEHMGGHEHIGEILVNEMCKRLRFSNTDTDVLRWTTSQHMRIAKLPAMKRTKQLRFLKSALSKEGDASEKKMTSLLHVLMCDAQASVHRASVWEPVFDTIVDLFVQLRELEEREAAHKLLDGHDIINLGAAPGPIIGQILDIVYDQIFSGQIQTREQALQAASKHVANFSKSLSNTIEE